MLTPNLRSTFYKFAFSDDATEELMAAQKGAQTILDKMAKKYNLTFSDRDDIDTAFGSEVSEAQYLGFVQGFNLAVQLITVKEKTI